MPGDWVRWDEIPLSWISEAETAKRNPGNQRTRNTRLYKDILCAWDIETAGIPGTDQAAVYHWQLQLGPGRATVYGRYLEEFPRFLDRLCEQLQPEETLVLYVHNLSYEFHFLRGVEPIRPDDVFALASRKPCRVWLRDKRIELRCSYILTNMGLGAWTKQMMVAHPKLDADDYDHTLVRYPWSELAPEELRYCRHDVLGLVEALQVQLDLHNDTLATIPLTSTGYVRRDVKRVMQNCYWTLQNVQPSDEVYLALREAFRGGNTHSNRWLSGCILSNIGSADRSSSYPDVCINRPMPMGKFKRDVHRYPAYLDRCITEEIPFLARLRFRGLRLSNQYDPCPYLSFSNMRDTIAGRPAKEFCNSAALDNGRILSIEQADITVTDVDWRIIRDHYTWDELRVLDLWTTCYDYLPDMLRSLIIKYYRDKTQLKGVAGQELQYNLAKALLNSIYGLMAQDPCKPRTRYDPDADNLYLTQEGDVHELLAKSRQRPYISYQWGVWVTAWARYELQRAIDAAGDMFVYCDTDSVKFAGELDLKRINRELISRSQENGANADDPKGRTHYMGEFEDEGRYDRFVTMGAKKYADEKDGRLEITISGVDKRAGAAELAAAGGLEEFREGFVFSAGGGLDPKYNDRTDMEVEIDGHQLHIGPNIYLHPSTYSLGLGDTYGKLIRAVRVLRELQHDNHIFKALQPRAL